MFVRAKHFNGRTYYYLVENKWVDGRVVQKVLQYIGKNKNARKLAALVFMALFLWPAAAETGLMGEWHFDNQETQFENTSGLVGLWHFNEVEYANDSSLVGWWRLNEPDAEYANDSLLAGHWHLNEGSGSAISDASGNGNNGTLNGSTWNSQGKFGSDLVFNGVYDGVVVKNGASLDGNASGISFETWFKPNLTSYGDVRVVMKAYHWFLKLSSATVIVMIENDSNSPMSASTDLGAFKTSKWYHVAATATANEKLRLYVDGAFITQVDFPGNVRSISSYIAIGQGAGASGLTNTLAFNGSVDEVAVYNRVLTAEEIRTHAGKHAHDYSGLGSNGNITSSALNSTWNSSGRFDYGLDLNATSAAVGDYVDLPNNASLDVLGAVTVEAWVKGTTFSSVVNVVVSRGYGASTNTQYLLDIESSGTPRFYMSNGAGMFYASGLTLSPGVWYHLAGTFDGTYLRMYVNGVKGTDSSAFTGSQSHWTTNGPCIGAYSSDHTYPFNGTIDEVAIYNRTLSENELKEHAGRRFRDYSGSGNAGALYGPGNGTYPVVSGKFGQGIEGNGTDGAIYVSHTSSLAITEQLTVEMWVKINPSNFSWPEIIRKEGQFYFSHSNAASPVLYFQTYTTTGWGTAVSTTLQTNRWYHVAGRVESSNVVSLWVDGKMVSSASQNPIVSGNSGLIITNYDSSPGGLDRPFNGTVDEVAVWNRSLGADEIKRHAGRTLFDSSGNANNGNRTNPEWAFGKFSGGLNVSNNYGEVPSSSGLSPTSQVTLEAWIKQGEGGSFYEIFVSKPGSYFLGGKYSGSSTATFGLFFSDASSQYLATSGTITSAWFQQWHHLAGTYNGSVMKIFVDGTLNNSFTVSKTIASNANSVLFGSYSGGGDYFNGTIDEVRIYNRSLSPTEVAAHAACNYTGTGNWDIPAGVSAWCRARVKTNGNITISGNVTFDTSLFTTGNVTNVTLSAGGTLSFFNTTVLMGGKSHSDNYMLSYGNFSANLTNFTRLGYNYGFALTASTAIDSSDIGYVQNNGMMRAFYASIGTGTTARITNTTFHNLSSAYGVDLILGSSGGAPFNFTNNRVTGCIPMSLAGNFTDVSNNVITTTCDGSSYEAVYSHPSYYGGGCWVTMRNNTFVTPANSKVLYLAGAGCQFTLSNNTFSGSQTMDVANGSWVYSKQHNGNASDTRIYGWFNYTKPIITRDTIAYWRFDEGSGANFYDYTGMNNGTITVGTNWTGGRFGKALRLDGIDDYVSIPDSASLDVMGDITIEMWVKPGAVQKTYADILSKHTNGGYVIEQDGGITNQYGFGWDTTGSGGWAVCSARTTLTAGVWQHFAVVKSGANVKHYVNGIKTAECNASSATISTNDLPLRIGEWSGGSNRNWNGTIDEVRISNRALLPSEFLPVEHDTAVNLMPGAAVRVGSDAIMAFDNVTENGTITSDGTLYRYKYYPIHVVNGSNANVAAASVNITDNFTLEFTNVTADGSGWAYPHAFVSATNNSVLMTVKHNLTAAKAGYGYNSIWMNTSAGNQTISLGSLSGYMIVNNVTATGFVPNVTVSTSPLAGPYYGVRTVEIRNGSQPVVTFQHDFSAGDLDLGTLTVRLGQYWVGFDGKLPATLYVPIRGVYCNVHVCPGITNTSETCSAGWSEWSSEPQGWYCLTTINGTVAEEQLDPAVTKLVAAPMSWEAVVILFFIAGGIVVFGKLMALRRPRKWRHKRKHKR